MVHDSYDAGNCERAKLPIEIYTTEELFVELEKRVIIHGTKILDDFLDWVNFYRSCELLAEASKVEDVT